MTSIWLEMDVRWMKKIILELSRTLEVIALIDFWIFEIRRLSSKKQSKVAETERQRKCGIMCV